MTAQELLKQGRLDEARDALYKEVRANPTDAKLRTFLFQLMAVMGEWEKALTHLNVAADLDPSTLLMAQVGRPAIAAEALRPEILSGKRTPLFLGKPDDWMGDLLEANKLLAAGHGAASEELRTKAFDAAPATSGSVNGEAFEWIADADSRFGPIFEAIVDGKYYWVPAHRVSKIEIEPPTDLRDLIWAPATFTWSTGGQKIGFLPVRYPGTEKRGDAAAKLSRRTDWVDEHGTSIGIGQRLFATDVKETPLLEIRELILNSSEPAPDAAEQG